MKEESKAVNVAINLGLICLCTACYVLIVILFISPSTYTFEPLVFVQPSKIKPTTAATLLAALLAACTSALVTRCAEHSLWIKLTTGDISAKESHRLAQWSISPLARLNYIFTGRGWFLKFSGLFLTGTSIIGPVLVSGISQHASTKSSVRHVPATSSSFNGYLNEANRVYNGGQFQDIPMTVAAIAHMSNLSAPASPVCKDDSCSVTTRSAALRADCKSKSQANPDGIGVSINDKVSKSYCSDIDTSLCLTLVRSNPSTYANFTTALTPNCANINGGDACNGEWCNIFGVWTNDGGAANAKGPYPINAVECTVTYGNVTITQNGGNTPTLDRSSFLKSTYSLQTYPVGQWRRIYSEIDENDTPNSPYGFSGRMVATGANTLYEQPVGWMLLGSHAGEDDQTVARRIEANFDMAALMAFARSPDSSDQTITTKAEGRQEWVYDKIVLLILLLPLLATLTGWWRRWRVCEDGQFVGYNPSEIASRASVLRVFHNEKF